jgi:adenylyl-sulfate kinase
MTAQLLGTGVTLWFTGLSGSGKSTIAELVAAELVGSGQAAYILDGDKLRRGLNADLGFSAADRAENVRRVGEVARILADAGCVALVPVISPYREDRDAVRRIHEESGLAFVEVHMSASLQVCEQRDPKGLYAKARAGELANFTGVSDPYEIPLNPDLELDTAELSPEDALRAVLDALAAVTA